MAMLVLMAIVAMCPRAGKMTRILGAVFAAYGLACLVGYLSRAEWFENTVLVSESAYIIGFMLLCFGFKGKENYVRAER